MTKTILQTPRLALREMTRGDLGFVAMMLADPQVMRFYPRCYTREEAEGWLERALRDYVLHGYSRWLVTLRATGEPIGQVGLVQQEVQGVAEDEIGYMIHAPYWRQGYAAEAAAGVRDHAFDALGKRRVISLVRPVNIASQRVALRIGMKPERILFWRELEHLVFSLKSRAGAAPDDADEA